jgi:hypothetical protein
MSRSARGSRGVLPAPRLIRAVGMSSRMCWKAHRLNGGSCQFPSVTSDEAGNGGAPAIIGRTLSGAPEGSAISLI